MTKAQIDQLRLQAVLAMPLLEGKHDSFEKGLCVMEAVAYVSGEPWSDHPQCACPVIASFLRSWNDRMPDDERQSLKQYIPLLVGSKATPEIERQRSWMLTDWVVRDCTPRWLRRAGMNSQAEILEAMKPLTNYAEYQSVRPAILAIRDETWPKREALREKVYAAVKAKIKSLPKFADAAAAAAAAADATAAAADAAAAAAADAATAAAAADADATSAAAAAAAATACWPNSWKFRDAIYQAVRKVYQSKLSETRAASQASAHELVKRLLALS